MKKISLLLIIALVLSAALLFASCGSENADVTDDVSVPEDAGTEDAGTESVPETDGTEPAETKRVIVPATTGNEENIPSGPIEGLETVSEEFDSTMVGDRFTTKQYKLIKSKIFVQGEKSYNWYEFYNACVAGSINIGKSAPFEYAKDCLSFFEELELADEADQARALIAEAEERRG